MIKLHVFIRNSKILAIWEHFQILKFVSTENANEFNNERKQSETIIFLRILSKIKNLIL